MALAILNAYTQNIKDSGKQKVFSQDYYDVLSTFNNIASKYPLLNKKAERKMIEMYRDNRTKLNSLLFFHNIRIVLNIARKYLYKTSSPADLLMNGARGLMVATEKFDPDKNIKFNTFATSWVFKYILMMFYSKSPVTGVNAISLNALFHNGDEESNAMDYLSDNMSDSISSSLSAKGNSVLANVDYSQIRKETVNTPSKEYEELSNSLMINDVINIISANPEFTEIDKEILYNNLMTNSESIKNISDKYHIPTNEINKRKRWLINNFRNTLSSKYNVNSLADVM